MFWEYPSNWRASPQKRGCLTLTWRRTQWPYLVAFSSATSATISCPCPRETIWNLPDSIVYPSFLPVKEIIGEGWVTEGEVIGKLAEQKWKRMIMPPLISLSLVQCILLLLKHFTKPLQFQQAKLRALNSGLIAGIRKSRQKSVPLVLR